METDLISFIPTNTNPHKKTCSRPRANTQAHSLVPLGFVMIRLNIIEWIPTLVVERETKVRAEGENTMGPTSRQVDFEGTAGFLTVLAHHGYD